MTRYTRKRTHFEAGFSQDEQRPAKREKDDADRKRSSEARRQRRITTKQSETICFACRGKGHAAKDCPRTSILDHDGLPREVVGVCYRCGSKKHSLSRCKRPENPNNPLPHASCFVCSQKGHLSSSCPNNAGRGIYPNGGSCKLCGQTDHLAKNCQLRRPELSKDVYFSGEHTGGADEDDFHGLKRRRTIVDQEEKLEQQQIRLIRNTVVASSNVNGVPAKRSAIAKPKVVAF